MRIDKLIGHKIADRFCITGEIGKGAMGRVFRAISFDDPTQDVAIKVIQSERKFDSEDLLRFQKEAALMSRLHHPNIICFHELGLLEGEDSRQDLGNGYYIVMEFANGMTLKESLRRDTRKDLAFFFQIGLQVSAALDYTHTKNIIHRDIKPQNIVVGRASKDQRGLLVKVLDFGVARLDEAMNHTEGALGSGEDIAGTPLYMAPEQSSLFEATVDHRIDLYSLGCVLYETLTGRTPFLGATRDKLLRQHAHETPESIAVLRPELPSIICDMVHKLLEKHPDDRYQSAFALHSDLLRVKRRLSRREKTTAINFPLALNDRFQGVSAKLSLVGRDREMGLLKESYESLLKGNQRSRMVVVSGEAGLGKTRLLTEFRNYLSSRKMRFVSANFSRHANSLEFNALANGFNEYLLRIYKKQAHEYDELKRKVKTLLGSSGHQVAAIVPGLKPFLEEEDEGFSDGAESFNFKSFAKAFSDFTRCLAIDDQPLVFIFDDLHWADGNSLELIDQFFSHNNSQRFLLVIAHRSIDGFDNERFSKFIEKFGKLRRRFDHLELDPFNDDQVANITDNLLAAKEPVKKNLVEYLSERSQKNPMHVVELVRTLVLRNFIYLRSAGDSWNYDVDLIHKANVRVDSIDLILTKIQDSSHLEKIVLQVASAVGLTFPFELLHLNGAIDASKIASILHKLMDIGFIARSPDDPEMAQLGKTYTFTHWRTRESVYETIPEDQRQALHIAIADRLEQAVTSQTPKIAFALAHHVNQALEYTSIADEQLTTRVIRHNRSAGELSWRIGALPTSQRYLELAFSMLESQADNIENRDADMADILEALADLDAEQKHLGKALHKYRRLLSTNRIRPDRLPTVVFKAMQVQAVSGMIRPPIKEGLDLSKKYGYQLPRPGFFTNVVSRLSIFRDSYPVPIRRHRLYKSLRTIFLQGKETAAKGNSDQIGMADVIILLQTLFLCEDVDYALSLHCESLSHVLSGKSPPAAALRTIGDRALILGYRRNVNISYQLLDRVIEVSAGLKYQQLTGYFYMQRALLMDYPRGRFEEIVDNVAKAEKYLSNTKSRLWSGSCFEFRLFSELMQGDLHRVSELGKHIAEVLPTRSWLSPRSLAFVLYSFLLKGSRDAIVSYAEPYLKRRRRVGARSGDLFISIIQVVLTFAKGEIDKTRKYFVIAMRDFCGSREKLFLYPFEEDFLALFAFTFPQLFEQEYGRRLMRDSEMNLLWQNLRKRVSKLASSDRDIVNLVTARSLEVLGKRAVSKYYDRAIQASKVSQYRIVQIFAYLWFGDYLFASGRRERSDFLLRGYKFAAELGLDAVAEYAAKILDMRRVKYTAMAKERKRDDAYLLPENQLSKFLKENLEHISTVIELDTALEVNLEESMAILQREFPDSRLVAIAHSEGEPSNVLFPYVVDSFCKEVQEYIAPYMNLRSTLFLPIQDATWEKSDVTTDRDSRSPFVVGRTVNSGDAGASLSIDDATVVIDHRSMNLPVQVSRGEETNDGVSDSERLYESGFEHRDVNESAFDFAEPALRMNALIPIRGCKGSFGVIFLENLNLQQRDSTRCRQDLDSFGNQLGLLFGHKCADNVLEDDSLNNSHETYLHQLGSFILEPVDWLTLAPHGVLRKTRECIWYLGLNFGEGSYLLVYCRLSGGENVRNYLSASLWYQLQVMRSMAVMSGKQVFDISEIREMLTIWLRGMKHCRDLENLSLTFTLFDRDQRWAYSGHFGPSRPVVFCQENRVRPHNDVVLSLANGRDIRFWTVVAPMSGLHLYLLAHDSSRLEANPSAQTMHSLRQTLLTSGNSENLFKIVEDLVHAENVPRYYLAAVQAVDEPENLEDDRNHEVQ